MNPEIVVGSEEVEAAEEDTAAAGFSFGFAAFEERPIAAVERQKWTRAQQYMNRDLARKQTSRGSRQQMCVALRIAMRV